MTLLELLTNLRDLDDTLNIFAEADPEWSAESKAALCVPREDGSAEPPTEAAGMTYLLDVGLAKEVVEVWRAWRGGRVPSPEDVCEAVIFYAKYDAYLPV
jgi:hypothetical protein